MKGSKKVQKEIKRVANIIVNQYKPEKIILFGSYAWGKPTRHSDADFLVVKKTLRNKIDRIKTVYQLVYNKDLPVDVIVFTPHEVKHSLERGDIFLSKAYNKGLLMYESKGR